MTLSSKTTTVLAFLTCLATACREDASDLRDILLVAQRPGGTEDTYALHLDDLTTRRLIEGDSFSSRSLPAWSPDTRSIAYIREFGDTSQLYVLDTIGGISRELAADLDGFLAWPDWSPDGRTILFTRGSPRSHDIYLIAADGSGLRRVVHDSTADFRCPSWATDGRRFVVAARTPGRSSILEFEVESGTARTLLTSDTTYLDCPQWSPLGDAVVLTIDPRKEDIWEADPMRPWRSDLVILDVKSGQLRTLMGERGLNNYGHWSQDGRWIVFQSNRHAAPALDSAPLGERFQSLEIYVVRSDGSDLRRVTNNDYFDGHPSW